MNDIDTAKYKEKLKQLHKIKMLLMHLSDRNKLTGSPRLHDALQQSTVVSLLAGLLGFGFDQLGETYFLWVLVVLFLIVAFYAYKTSSRKDTWLEEIDNKLMDYEPVDVRAYQYLQQEILASDLTRIADVCSPIEDWLVVERGTIKEALNPEVINARIATENKQGYKLKFVEKIIDRNTN